MRVIGGKAKGHLLKVPKGQTLRPTAARVKEALFNILPHNLSGYKVLDLFAGSGNLSVEALSRGAAETILVDASRKAGMAIRYNLEVLGFSGRSEVWIASVLPSLRLLSRRGTVFDLIFLDPPYERNWISRVLKAVAQKGLLREGGVVVVEHSKREEVKKSYAGITLQDQRRYGGTLLSFFGHVKARPQ